MSRVKCNSCGGVYDTQLPDGSTYFHACPPLSGDEVKRAIESGSLQLTVEQRARVDAAAAVDAKAPVAAGETSRVDQVYAELAITRPNTRNENIRGFRSGGDPTAAIAAGPGVTKMAGGDQPSPKI